jgi:hypothetical protein
MAHAPHKQSNNQINQPTEQNSSTCFSKTQEQGRSQTTSVRFWNTFAGISKKFPYSYSPIYEDLMNLLYVSIQL